MCKIKSSDQEISQGLKLVLSSTSMKVPLQWTMYSNTVEREHVTIED